MIKTLQLLSVDSLLLSQFKKIRKAEAKLKRKMQARRTRFLHVNSNGRKYLKSN
jgi:hypothetical protein